MSVLKYKKYQILLSPDSKKTQGLRTGDIVRRQYNDGANTIYSLMCVLSYGVEQKKNADTGVLQSQPYFIGALIDGDEPKQNELLDFVRVTSMFDTERTGALYLTASDEQSPFMDVIDNIGRSESLSWPEGIAIEQFKDSMSQYVVQGLENLQTNYTPVIENNHRVLSITRLSDPPLVFEGLKQDFFQYIENPDCVLISFKARANQPMRAKMSVGYENGNEVDGEWTDEISTQWEYKFHSVIIEHSGRYLRSFQLSLADLIIGNTIEIADFNIILLSSISNFENCSAVRIGKLNGIVDPVFGKLDGYGGYLQDLYASRAAHISGTLTAGDENGFGSTFYAGKIHRNCFVNSIEPQFIKEAVIAKDIKTPASIGNVYVFNSEIVLKAQSDIWLHSHFDKKYCFSCWVFTEHPRKLLITQNEHTVGVVDIIREYTNRWYRVHICVNLKPSQELTDCLMIGIKPIFDQVDDTHDLYFTSPQLEQGEKVTQYQATDELLNYTDAYGAWFSRGGIGGTIQNPLLKLNPDGSISSKNDSFVINADGTGYFADKRFSWTKDKISLKDIVIKWEDLAPDSQDEIKAKSINILGEQSFVLDGDIYEPAVIYLTVKENCFTTGAENYRWYYLNSGGLYSLLKDGGKELTVTPDGTYWNGKNVLMVKCVVSFNHNTIVDTITIQKVRNGLDSYSLKIFSSNGNTFKNGIGTTELTAHVYRGNQEITDTLFRKDFDWIRKSSNPDTDRIFNETHLGWGNKLVITSDDVYSMAQFDCQVRIK